MIVIDGSAGEGGGQILRTALALSLITRRPFRIENIRAGRSKPGLLRQHLTAVNAAKAIGNAQATGDALGSRELAFVPGEVRGGTYKFATGGAGSTTLVFQTILFPLLFAKERAEIELEGGTHNPSAPPFPYLESVFAPLLRRMCVSISVELVMPGFYPAGGGRFRVVIEPCEKIGRLELHERGVIRARRVRAIVCQVPGHVALRELETVKQRLDWPDVDARPDVVRSPGPGNVLTVEVESANVTEMFVAFGERGVRAETVAERVADETKRYIAANVPVGEHLADQLVLPLALGEGGSFVTTTPSGHLRTQIETVSLFLDRTISITAVGDAFRVATA